MVPGGMLVTPGLINLRMHAFLHGHLLSVDVDELAPRSGTTTFVDGGSSGSLNFLAFREQVIKRMKKPHSGLPEHLRHRPGNR